MDGDVHGIIVSGEASESDEDEELYYCSKQVASTKASKSVQTITKTDTKLSSNRHNSLLHQKLWSSQAVISVEVQTKCLKKITLTVTLKPFMYPTEVPPLSLKCLYLSRNQCGSIKEMLLDEVKLFQGGPMLFQIISYLKQLDLNFLTDGSEQTVNEETFSAETCLLKLDHIRHTELYIKSVQRWVNQLQLDGRLIFCKHLILILLQGTKENIKKYILKNKTQNVDVDSRGKPCKEKLLTILEISSSHPPIPSGFSIETLPCLEDLTSYFASIRLNGLNSLIESLIKH